MEEQNVNEPEKILEENRRKYEEAMKKIEESRIPLNEQTSTDVIQRIRTLSEILQIKITIPKIVTEVVNKKPISKYTGSVELNMFPYYGETEKEQAYIRGIYSILCNRLIDLAKLL